MSTLTLKSTAKSYWILAKPGIIFGNITTTIAGFSLASQEHFNLGLFLATLIGISLIMASSCVFNNYIDRELDSRMARTKNRPLVKKHISEKAAFIFGTILGIFGMACLFLWTSMLATAIALTGFFVYIFLYSFLKYKTVYGTLIGSVAGAIPPVVGYCAVSHSLDLCAFILFAIVVFWQMPHFFAIAIYRLDDYVAGSIPVLPAKEGIFKTKVQMLIYMIAFIGAVAALFIGGYVGYGYLVLSLTLGIAWLIFCIKGFSCSNDKLWARQMFIFSLVVIMGIAITIPLAII